MNKDIECPYCGHEQDINHDDGYGYEQDTTHQQECGSCEKTFIYTTSIVFYYDVDKADCLNDGEHEYEPTVTYPKCCTKMRCKQCGGEREPTKEECSEYNIPTKEEYFRELKDNK